MRIAGLITLAFCAVATTAATQSFQLDLPIDCALGSTCYIQNYVDSDPSKNASDHTCNALTYDTHKGTDFALTSRAQMESGVNVLAVAPGTIVGLRDGMADTGLTAETATDIEGRECGNGVVIQHRDGWTSQYCHMKQGSITVVKGARIDTGTILGKVGLSGRTEFPHVHLSLRHKNLLVDPFDPDGVITCGAPSPDTLWRSPLAYQPGGIITAGFATQIPSYDAIKSGTAATDQIAPDAPALVLWGHMFGSRAGDTMRLDIAGPEGWTHSQTVTLEKPQAQLFRATGKRLTKPWPTGDYTGTVTLLRDGTEINRRQTNLTVQ